MISSMIYTRYQNRQRNSSSKLKLPRRNMSVFTAYEKIPCTEPWTVDQQSGVTNRLRAHDPPSLFCRSKIYQFTMNRPDISLTCEGASKGAPQSPRPSEGSQEQSTEEEISQLRIDFPSMSSLPPKQPNLPHELERRWLPCHPNAN